MSYRWITRVQLQSLQINHLRTCKSYEHVSTSSKSRETLISRIRKCSINDTIESKSRCRPTKVFMLIKQHSIKMGHHLSCAWQLFITWANSQSICQYVEERYRYRCMHIFIRYSKYKMFLIKVSQQQKWTRVNNTYQTNGNSRRQQDKVTHSRSRHGAYLSTSEGE
jgi:hypothetical protein